MVESRPADLRRTVSHGLETARALSHLILGRFSLLMSRPTPKGPSHRSPACGWTPRCHVEHRLDGQTQVPSSAAALALVARLTLLPHPGAILFSGARRPSAVARCPLPSLSRAEAPREARAQHGPRGSPKGAARAAHRRGSLRWGPGALRLRAHRRRLPTALAWRGRLLHRGLRTRLAEALGGPPGGARSPKWAEASGKS